jgi:hypothetical protein
MTVAALSNKNPYYVQREIDWVMARDSYGGERYIKEKSEEYLPATNAMVADGMDFNQIGWNAYQAYRARAVYPEIVRPSLMSMLGVMHRKPPTINLPAKLEPLRDRATFNGESLNWLLQKINEQQMLMARIGLMLDVADGAKVTAMPYIVTYNAEAIINWDSSKVGDDKGLRQLQLVVLNETDFERTAGLAWRQMMRYRVLAMAGDVRVSWPDIKAGDNEYVVGDVRHSQDIHGGDFWAPQLGGRTLNAIPFVFCGPRDLVPEPDIPVVMPLARIALAIYRTEADYRQALYMQGQDTLVVVGQQADANAGKTRVGAFGSIDLPIGGSASYIGAQSSGISDLCTAIENDHKRASQLGAQLLTERGNEAEAAGALGIRVASRTATLTTVANAGAGALQQILRHAAVWVGANPDEVSVIPNLDFAENVANAQDSVYLVTAKNQGMVYSKRSLHGWLARNNFTEITYEEELKEVDNEPKTELLGTPGMAGATGATPGGKKSGGNTPTGGKTGKEGA